MMRVLALASILGLALSAAPASAVSIINGSFELGTNPGGAFSTPLAGDSTTITGWKVGGRSVDYIGGYWQAANGVRSIDLAGSVAGEGIDSIAQGIVTTLGQIYRVTFSVARNPDAGLNPRTGFIDVGGAATLISFNQPTSTKANMMWETRSYVFTATSALTMLRFSADPATSQNFYGLALDNVSIQGVPEPASWALMLFGFGAMGFALRTANGRRRQAPVQRVKIAYN